MKESNVRNNLIKWASKNGITLFNNPAGQAYVGQYQQTPVRCILNPRVIKFGLCDGSSDLIGITSIEITKEMVGKKIGVFVAVEVKKDKHGKYKEQDNQAAFGSFVRKNGGIYTVADNENDILHEVDTWKTILKNGVK